MARLEQWNRGLTAPPMPAPCPPAPKPGRDSCRPDRLFLSPPHLGEAEFGFVGEAFKSNYIAPLGPMVDAFEQEFARFSGIPHCLALASGTSAMHLALRELGVGAGDEVLASTLTFIGSVSPVVYLGAKPGFVDSDASTWTMDPELLGEELAARRKSGKLPKAVVPTDLYGQCANLPRLKALCEPYGIPVISDAAEAMGAFYQEPRPPSQRPENRDPRAEAGTGASGQYEGRGRFAPTPERNQQAGTSRLHSAQSPVWRHAGAGSKAAVYSFNGNKIITTGGGGLLASEDAALIAHARKLSQQAREAAAHYEHLELGYNYRMSNVLAAIGRGQLQVLEERVMAKRRIFESYRQLLGGLPGLEFMPEAPYGRCNRWLTVVLIHPGRFGAAIERVRLALEQENIEARPVWKPMHLQPVFRGCRIRGGALSERLFREGLCLPSGTAMTSSDIERVAEVIRRCSCVGRKGKGCALRRKGPSRPEAARAPGRPAD